MTVSFLKTFMHAARDITGADRALAVDLEMQVQATHNLDEHTLKTPRFSNVALLNLRRALDQQVAILANNVVTTPAEAPITNTSFSDLRVVVAIPVPTLGAVYLDQHIRQGVIPRETIDRLFALAQAVIAAGDTGLSAAELVTRYGSQPTG
ncbi:MAG: hypothetical protein MUE40_11110 [Anaerolineae bacterium]|jgi:hypothetical protein|nr:hypothetical protein [Anaerolineae bacterium]